MFMHLHSVLIKIGNESVNISQNDMNEKWYLHILYNDTTANCA